MKHFLYFTSLFLVCIFDYIYPDVYGSDTAVSAIPFFTAPSNPAIANRIANFGWAQNGFALKNAFSSIIFDSVFPMSGPIQLNGGTITLNRDLLLSNTTTLQGLGTIVGGGHILSLNEDASSLPPNTNSFQNTRLILNSDIIIQSPITFSGSCGNGSYNLFSEIEGNGHTLTLMGAGAISNNGQLAIRNLTLQGVSGSNVQNANSASVLTLDNVTWIQTGSSVFTTGSMIFDNTVTFRGAGTSFTYQSNQQSLIATDASLTLASGLTFVYAPSAHASETLLGFPDATGQLILHGATLQTTGVGLTLLRGSLIAMGNSFLAPDVGQVITLGDGNFVNDMATTIAAGARLKVLNGSLSYSNLLSTSWIMENSVSILEMGLGTVLQLYETMNLGVGIAVFDNGTVLQRAISALLLGSIQTLGVTTFQII
jgi:hypothetical protein